MMWVLLRVWVLRSRVTWTILQDDEDVDISMKYWNRGQDLLQVQCLVW